ncbi:MAG: hypothetical protein J6I54_00065 [Bacteroidaceae bacterium]|nr:hypothetical protein [Bacteroidaceae bacterium]MBR1467616.1 hypothetical protein [Bacteroidaceae bacterium]
MKEPKGMFTIHGEPKIAEAARRHILREFEDLEFYEEGHLYILHGQSLNSVSSIGHRFIREPFDEQKQAARYAMRHGQTADYWIRQWQQNSFRATTLGTKTHEFGESLGYLKAGLPQFIRDSIKPQYMPQYGYLAPIHPKEEAVVRFMQDMPPTYHLVLNEAKVYSGKNPQKERNLQEQICGTFDMLYYYDGEGDESKAGFVILDYKTNNSLYSEYNQRFGKTLLPPFDTMIEEDLSLYTIQLSLYALMLEDIGIPVTDRKIVWLDNEGEYKIISVCDVSGLLRECI